MKKSELIRSIKKQREVLQAALVNLTLIEKSASQLPEGKILKTRMKAGLDPAFIRRLSSIVNFPVPSADERRQVWEKVFQQDDGK